ncbi:hypothetical protein [Halopenitus sp. POP-27]|uniref:hypothetical protein n=1 Tax=Halopenitus sp. POP-27 TaxID=2994425 RepID=UPI002469B1FA|nr:hypothetical protein [Halopenitus sp. POP-27]
MGAANATGDDVDGDAPVGDVRSAATLAGDDRVRYRGDDRFGGTLCVTDRRIVIGDVDGVGDDGASDDRRTVDGHAIPLQAIEEVTYRSTDWFTLLLGVGIVAFGLASISRSRLGAAAFVVVGLGSLVVTWRRRGRVRIHTHGRPKPVTVHPVDPDAFLAAVDASLESVRSG